MSVKCNEMNCNKMRCFCSQMNGRTSYKRTRAEGMKGKTSRGNHLSQKTFAKSMFPPVLAFALSQPHPTSLQPPPFLPELASLRKPHPAHEGLTPLLFLCLGIPSNIFDVHQVGDGLLCSVQLIEMVVGLES